MRKIKLICTVIGFVMVLIGCRVDPEPRRSAAAVNSPTTTAVSSSQATRNQGKLKNPGLSSDVVTIHPSWVHLYDELEELVRSSDLIIEGVIERVVGTRAQPPEESPTIYTDYAVKISRVLKSYPGFANESIIVGQRGGTWQGIAQIVEDDEPFEVGEQVFLFLREGQSGYSAMVPGGRFKINPDGTLDSPVKKLDMEIVNKYWGKAKTELENQVLAILPEESDYIGLLYPAFLIAEGIVRESTTRLDRGQEDQETQLVYTVYSFQVKRVLHDELEATKSFPHKTPKYQKSPVKKGDVVTIFELGGTYGDVTTPRLSTTQGMPPGSRMILFLGSFACEERPFLCTQEERDSGKAMYLASDPGRFLLDSDNRLKPLKMWGFIGRLYEGKSKEKLEQDLSKAKEEWEAKSKATDKGTASTAQTPPPPTRKPTR